MPGPGHRAGLQVQRSVDDGLHEYRFPAQDLKIGKTCFWSRSRKEYWVKGMTSGHFQYVKIRVLRLRLRRLIKVRQVGAACHTFRKSCFFYRKIKVMYKIFHLKRDFEFDAKR